MNTSRKSRLWDCSGIGALLGMTERQGTIEVRVLVKDWLSNQHQSIGWIGEEEGPDESQKLEGEVGEWHTGLGTMGGYDLGMGC